MQLTVPGLCQPSKSDVEREAITAHFTSDECCRLLTGAVLGCQQVCQQVSYYSNTQTVSKQSILLLDCHMRRERETARETVQIGHLSRGKVEQVQLLQPLDQCLFFIATLSNRLWAITRHVV